MRYLRLGERRLDNNRLRFFIDRFADDGEFDFFPERGRTHLFLIRTEGNGHMVRDHPFVRRRESGEDLSLCLLVKKRAGIKQPPRLSFARREGLRLTLGWRWSRFVHKESRLVPQ